MPDVPGFTAHIETADLDAALTEARIVLAAHLAEMVDVGCDMPDARSITELRADPDLARDWAEAAGAVMLSASVPAGS